MESVHRELQTERGLYLENWVRTKNRWWMELFKAVEIDSKGLRFVGRVKEISFPFDTAAKLSELLTGMPPAKREEFRQRLLSFDNISPVLAEINMAAHFWQMGFDLEWAEPKSQGEKIPEFIAKNETLSYDVECKTKTADAGRMIAQPRFYRLVDRVADRLRERGLHGDVRIIVSDRLPGDNDWQTLVVNSVGNQSPGVSKEFVLDNGTSITTSLLAEDIVVPKQALALKLASLHDRFPHADLATDFSGTECVNPIVIHVESRRTDTFRKSVLEDLREAKRQLSGNRAGIIICSVPEAQSFTKHESALRELTEHFFENHAPNSLYGVTFASDRKIATFDENIEILYPTKTFYNSRYDSKWGPATEYMATSF